jgi:hypothetical protein
MEYRHDQHVAEARMHPGYLEKEGAFREQAAKLWADESSVGERIRSNVALTAEEREAAYREAYQGPERRLEELVGEFGRDIGHDVFEAERTLHQGTGAKFAEHLTALASVPDEKLSEIMTTARRSSQPYLERAIALTAYERGVRPVWSSWAEANPQARRGRQAATFNAWARAALHEDLPRDASAEGTPRGPRAHGRGPQAGRRGRGREEEAA